MSRQFCAVEGTYKFASLHSTRYAHRGRQAFTPGMNTPLVQPQLHVSKMPSDRTRMIQFINIRRFLLRQFSPSTTCFLSLISRFFIRKGKSLLMRSSRFLMDTDPTMGAVIKSWRGTTQVELEPWKYPVFPQLFNITHADEIFIWGRLERGRRTLVNGVG